MQFQEVLRNFSDDLKKIDQIILEFAAGKSPLIHEISNHLISSGGKRIRPILVLLSSRLFSQKEIYNLAAAVELIHSATLLHDDVVDSSEIRRGKKTANAIWDNKASILVGDFIFSIAFQLMVKSQNLAVLDLLSKTSSIMADGEVLQLENSNSFDLSEAKYYEIIFGKTAVLFSAACECGALINDASAQEIEALREFGKNLGMLFQIIDDILDYSAKEQVLGKDVGNDFFEGKITLPIILTYQNASKEDRKNIKELFEKNLFLSEKNPEDFAKILSLIEKNQGLALAKNKALDYKNLALKNLEIFVDSTEKQGLISALDHALMRVF